MGLTIREPRLGWKPPAGTVRQAAYRISAGNGWDTGRVESAESGGIPYSGPALDSRSRFEWRVRTWNIDPAGTETASGWSEPMSVELGLLHASDWTAQWIGPGDEDVPAPGGRPGPTPRRGTPSPPPGPNTPAGPASFEAEGTSREGSPTCVHW